MEKKKVKTYIDTLMINERFREKFEQEYQNLCISEQIFMARKAAHLTQAALAKRIHTTKSAISRYESAEYKKYSVSLLNRIARACQADLKVCFLTKKNHSFIESGSSHSKDFATNHSFKR